MTLATSVIVPFPVSDRFALIVGGLCRAVAAGRGGLSVVLIVLVWGRLRRMAVRFAVLAARPRESGIAPVTRVRPVAAKRPAQVRLPQGFAWLMRLVPGSAAYASQLQYLLTDPEMVGLLEAAPGIGRVMRPLCQMLGVRFTAPARKVAAEPAAAQQAISGASMADDEAADRRGCGGPVEAPAPFGSVGRAAPW